MLQRGLQNNDAAIALAQNVKLYEKINREVVSGNAVVNSVGIADQLDTVERLLRERSKAGCASGGSNSSAG